MMATDAMGGLGCEVFSYFRIHSAQQEANSIPIITISHFALPEVGVHTDFNPGLTSEQAAATQW